MSTPAASAIVLAGGRSARFGRDKLAELLDGRALLDHAIEAVAAVAREIIVVGPPGSEERPLSDAGSVTVRIASDPEPFGGPLVGLLAGLGAAREPLALLVGGDMPGLRPAVLEALLRALDEAKEVAAAALEHDGAAQPLPLALRVETVGPVVRDLLAADERSLRALLERLDVHVLGAAAWRALDESGTTLWDIDTPADIGPTGPG